MICDVQVRLIASVPGYHSGSNFKKWGHMKLRTVLQECTFEKEFHMSPLVCQVNFDSSSMLWTHICCLIVYVLIVLA